MTNFIEVGNQFLNINDIKKVEILSDDIYPAMFPRDDKGKVLVDFIPYAFAIVHTFSGAEIELEVDLYQPEENETDEMWCGRNRSYISQSLSRLTEILNVSKITGFEYQ